MTGLDYIQGALELLGEYTAEEEVDGADGQTAFKFLKSMLNSWSAWIGPVFTVTLDEISLVTGTQNYTVGPTGDHVTTRPINIIKGTLRDAQDVDHDMDLQALPEYEQIILKDTGSALSWVLGYNMTNPNINIYLYPPPDSTYTLRLLSYKELTAPTMASEYSVPPGYDDAIMFNLAVRLAPTFGAGNVIGSPSNPTSIAGMAVEMYRQLIISNTEPEGVSLDPMQPGNEPILRSWKYE